MQNEIIHLIDLLVDWAHDKGYKYEASPAYHNPSGALDTASLYLYHDGRSITMIVTTDALTVKHKGSGEPLPENTINAADPDLFKKLEEYFTTKKYYMLY